MISVKYAIIIAVAAFAAGSFFSSPLPQAIAEEVVAAVVANNVICNGCVGTSDLANNAVTSPKIKDGEVKAADIGANAVGASEIKGVTKLDFTSCSISNSGGLSPGVFFDDLCHIPGATTSDRFIVTKEFGNPCITLSQVDNSSPPAEGFVRFYLLNSCNTDQTMGTQTFSVIVYRPG